MDSFDLPLPGPTGPSLNVCDAFPSDGVAAEESARKARYEAQQNQLADRRDEFAPMFKQWRDIMFPMIKLYNSALVNKTHVGDWGSLWPLMFAVGKMPTNCRHVTVCLGGWYLDRSDIVCVTNNTPGRDLVVDMEQYAIHAEILGRYANWLYEKDTTLRPKLRQKLVQTVERYQHQVPELKQESDYGTRLVSYCNKRCKESLGFIEDQLLFMKDRMFWFVSTPGHPEAGLNDFTEFVNLYDCLPKEVKQKYGPYYLTIRSNPKKS